MLPFNTTFSTKFEQTCQDRRNRIAADIETNEAFPDRETNPTDLDKLELQKDLEHARRSS